MDAWKRRWGAGQWAAFFEHQALPVLGRSKILLAGLEEAQGDLLSPKDLSDIVLQDPMLCLCLLREAERDFGRLAGGTAGPTGGGRAGAADPRRRRHRRRGARGGACLRARSTT